MAKCPECNAEIDYLIYVETATKEFVYQGLGEHSPIGYPNVDDSYFKCPECNSVLFSDEEIASDFLSE